MTVQNLQLTNNYNGLLIAYTQNSTITGNALTNNWEGLNLIYSSGNVLSGNSMHANRYAFSVNGRLANDVDATNTVDGKPIIYWVDQHDKTVPSDACYVALINCTGITVQNLDLSNNRQGILLINTRDSIITQNTITNQSSGIELESSLNNIISNNFIHSNTNFGIHVGYSDSNLLAGNTITGNLVGVHVNGSSHNSIYRNSIIANNMAVSFVNSDAANSSYNTVTENNITLNEMHVYMFPDANYNTLYHNNFVNNTDQLDDPYSGNSYYPILLDMINSWDNGSEGNYWSDYEEKFPNATELGNSGVWNMPYYVNFIGVDNFPLIHPLAIPRFSSPKD